MRPAGTYRALLFGDSQTAGYGVSNKERFSDLLEKAIPGLEIYNYGICASAPDQNYITYRTTNVEHDLVIIAVYIETVRKVSCRVLESIDEKGNPLFYSKPYFEVEGGELIQKHLPVPKELWSEETLPAKYRPYIYKLGESHLTSYILGPSRKVPRILKAMKPVHKVARSLALRFSGYRQREYDSADHPTWVLLRTILESWSRTSPTPVLLVPIPNYACFRSSHNGSKHQKRFRELAGACHLYDPFPDLMRLSLDERRLLWSDSTGHLTAKGHEVLGGLLEPVIRKLKSAHET